MNITQDKVPTYLKQTLKSLRVRTGLTQEEASKLLGVSKPTLKRWEDNSGVLDYEQILLIEKIYHIPRDYIFFGTPFAFSEKMNEELQESMSK